MEIGDLTLNQVREIQSLVVLLMGKVATTISPKERAVLVTTEYRGVFFGFATDTDGDVIKLRAARNCIYWSSDVGGFQGLANTGPTSGCRISAPADIELRKITCVAEVTETATATWVSAKTYKD